MIAILKNFEMIYDFDINLKELILENKFDFE